MSEIDFNTLDELASRDPLSLSKQDLDTLIMGMRAYRAAAMGKSSGKAMKFSDVATQPVVDMSALLKAVGAPVAKPIKRRL